MTVHVTIELDDEEGAQLQALAELGAMSREDVAKQLLAERLDYDRWFRARVREGIEAADRGELIDHEEVLARSAARREKLLAQSRS